MMVPYQGRFALRVGRVCLALACLVWYPFTGGGVSYALVFLIAYAIFSVGTLFETHFDSSPRAFVALVIDFTFFVFCKWLVPGAWAPALALGYVLISVAVMHTLRWVIVVTIAAMLAMFFSPLAGAGMIWTDLAAAALAIS